MKLIQTKDHLLLIDEEAEIKEGKTFITKENIIHTVFGYNYGDRVVIAYYPLTKEAKELDLPLLPNPFEKEIDVEKLAQEVYREYPTNPKDKPDWTYNRDIHVHKKRKAFIAGYKAAQSKQFSLEDMKKAIEMARVGFKEYPNNSFKAISNYIKDETNRIIQSLSTQQLPKEFIPEYEEIEVDKYVPKMTIDKLKTIINSEYKEEIVGTYKY